MLLTAASAAANTAKHLFEHFGAKTVVINNELCGEKINVGCGAMHLEPLAKTVVNERCDMGFAFDGDADRIIGIDAAGQILDGDKLLFIAAKRMAAKGELKDKTIVGTLMSNLGLETALKNLGIDLVRVDVGDKYIIEKMNESGYVLGGESSGHIIFGQKSTTGDGVLTALLTATAVKECKGKLSALLTDYHHCPQYMKNIAKTPAALKVLQSEAYQDFERQTTISASEPLRLLVRPSGTEPVIRIMAECQNHTTAVTAVEIIEEWLTTNASK